MKIVIIDYGMGNLGSVKRSFEECGADVEISDKPTSLDEATGIVLPGVGAFGDGMKNLSDGGWVAAIKKAVLTDNVPLLGVCLGMQLLADKSAEGGEFQGLGLISGEVKCLVSTQPTERIPHVGWNEIYSKANDILFSQINDGTDFYFVHSYHFVPKDKKSVLATTPYCGEFVSAVKRDLIYGVQFHPEKSSKPGFALIRNFLSVC